ncbi:branched-chain alpha-keto acid dehydrogenase subunit E2 [Stutzerimonas decontaminans]|uniref:Flagellar hook-associated protein 2 n=2 Tax=Stutzerimonas TaxID=2901164 RepID=A0ABX4VU22_9GAMM|nr:flagellar filament capping protein FliD [Stutzerimonas decontaminans]AHY43292.1 branched-chain alpha-keto acid dehydrogenase subunit E2 [Stutzerimonas decontaminans]MCQ4246901.1 flagellar filament capping protein FliD [Stutzerimonas decontaminans]MCW8157726.1 branched-chain alpha-keto acid dehydrogenase subunit E2 [Stutzerimonas stutzeri]PNF83672.1 branched-chain alpha-keto acid dehydrogenase subunit E2 [Stutzerimonas decontaminans]
MAGVTGIGSGIDIDSIVKSMVAAERAPKESQLKTLESKTTTRITAIGALKSAITEFQTALGNLNKPELFQARAASSSKSELLSVKAGVTAGAGSYKVAVSQLAAGSKVALQAFQNDPANPVKLGTGTLTVSIGSTALPAITVDESNNTLAGIRDAINKAGAEKGVSATIVTDDAGSRLVLSSTTTGAGEDVTVAVDAASGDLAKLAFAGGIDKPGADGSAGVISAARSALLTVDGLSVTSKTNTVDSAIEGVTLELKGLTEADQPLTVGVTLDEAGVKKQVQSFVDAYNKLIGVINSQTKVTPVGDDKAPVTGALVGDATARTLLNTIRNELVTVQGSGSIRALTDIGITTQKDGTLKVDEDKLAAVMDNSFEELSGLFAGEKGLATRLDEKLKPYTETGGILEQRNKVMAETISKIDKQKEDLDRRITSLQERLYKQFNAMDLLVGQLSNTSSSLLASLENLPWAASNSKK